MYQSTTHLESNSRVNESNRSRVVLSYQSNARTHTWDNIHSGFMSMSQLKYTTNRQSIQTQKSLNGTNIKNHYCKRHYKRHCSVSLRRHCPLSLITIQVTLTSVAGTVQATLTSVAGTVYAKLTSVAPRTAGSKRPLFWFVRLDFMVQNS